MEKDKKPMILSGYLLCEPPPAGPRPLRGRRLREILKIRWECVADGRLRFNAGDTAVRAIRNMLMGEDVLLKSMRRGTKKAASRIAEIREVILWESNTFYDLSREMERREINVLPEQTERDALGAAGYLEDAWGPGEGPAIIKIAEAWPADIGVEQAREGGYTRSPREYFTEADGDPRFYLWLRETDAAFSRMTGLAGEIGIFDFPDTTFRDYFDEEKEPEEMAELVMEENRVPSYNLDNNKE